MFIDQVTMGSGASGVPPGLYQGEFLGVEETPPNTEKGYGPGFRWSWKIVKGPSTGLIASRVTGDKPSAKNACGQLINALAGRTVGPGETVSFASFVGKRYSVIVAATGEKGTRVETVAPEAG